MFIESNWLLYFLEFEIGKHLGHVFKRFDPVPPDEMFL